MAELTKEQADLFTNAIICESTLFKQLSDTATAAAETLAKTPETETILITVASLDMIRTLLTDMSSGDAERIEAATKLLKGIVNL